MKFTSVHLAKEQKNSSNFFDSPQEAAQHFPENTFIVPVLTKNEWDRMNPDFKSYKNGEYACLYVKDNGATVYSPCYIQRPVAGVD